MSLIARFITPFAGYLAIALAGSLALNLHQWRAGAVQSVRATAQVDRASDANAGALASIAVLRQSLALCEAGRLLDASAQAVVLAEHNAQFQALAQRAATARAQVIARNAGACWAWAEQPACGVVP